MTLIMLGAVLADRPALTMRNLAFAALAVIALEPEALLGASFQLSFAAVAALVAVYETRHAAAHGAAKSVAHMPGRRPKPSAEARSSGDNLKARSCGGGPGASLCDLLRHLGHRLVHGLNFHELSPYVLIGNPLTLTLIEFFAVPGALFGNGALSAWARRLGLAHHGARDQLRPDGSLASSRSPRAPPSTSMNSRPGPSSFWRSPFFRR